ncbi:polyphenol oxidase family protein [Actinotignum urinale]|uniref:polyphenol oxidase family protein n=1 Tax=Actinotignum urinale TaxID=190146 RepID=UPI00280C0779|nr:polyphenol oxidase family protein [Actinotignum urinale]
MRSGASPHFDWVVDMDVPSGHIRAGFTTRWGGVSSEPYDDFNLGYHVGDNPRYVQENRFRIASLLGVMPVFMDQVHKDRLDNADFLTSQQIGEAPATDGLLIGVHDIKVRHCAAAVMVADCIPLILVASDRPAGAVVHVGRKGLLAHIATKAVQALGNPENLTAYLGPSICGKCYEVPRNMQEESARLAPGISSTTSWGTPALDLPSALIAQLAHAGVGNVHSSPVCTLESPDYFSYRRSQRTGRCAGVLHIEDFSGVF